MFFAFCTSWFSELWFHGWKPLISLEPGTTYYLRAYAKNSAGVSYGEQVSFTTANGLPTVTTADVTSITSSTAVCGGTVTTNGGFNILDFKHHLLRESIRHQ